MKDPETGRRVSRQNPSEAWITTEVPELRIVEDALWDRVKARQGEIEAEPRIQAIKATEFWKKRRQTHLLTGLLRCGCCGGGFASVGKDYVACAAARKLGTCEQRRSFRRAELEEAVLDLLRTRLMQPDAVAEFVRAFSAEVNAQRGDETAARSRQEAERAALKRKLDGLYDAIADGMRTPGLKQKLEDMEARVAALDEALTAPAPAPVRLQFFMTTRRSMRKPFLTIRRIFRDFADGVSPPAIAQRLNAEGMLEVEHGSIAPGKFATFTILEADPFAVGPDAIKDIKVWGTMLEGRVFPAPPVAAIDEASLIALWGVMGPAPLYALAPVAPVAGRGTFGGCGACASPWASSCAPGATAAASSMGCCSTNALGWAVAAAWAARV